ncbi:MAG: hypothetical protein HY721_13300 [Planctomycetes bacterium]|nr:hypothetical protein [Planctomycetota bacterium]
MARKLTIHLAAGLLGACPMVLFWSGLDAPVEPDGYFHLSIARDYALRPFDYSARIREGALAAWPADREPLFHLALAGLLKAGLDEVRAAMVLAAIAAALLGAVISWHTGSFLAAACGLFGSHTVLYRLHMCRPQGLAIVMVVLGTALLLRGRSRAAAGVNLVYTLSYSVPVLILGAAVLRSLATRDWRPLAWVLGASAAGLLLHPHFPANVCLLWYQGYHVVSNAVLGNPLGVRIPEELLPWSLDSFTTELWLPLALLGVALWRRSEPWWLLVILVAGLLATLRMRRVGEYWAPLVALTAGPTLRWIVPARPALARSAFVTLILLVTVAPNTYGALVQLRELPVAEYKAVGEWLAANAPGQSVFNADWDSYGQLRYYSPRSWWVHGQDPVFLAAHDPGRHRRVTEAIRGELGPDELRGLFGTRFVLARRGAPLLGRLEGPGARVRFSDRKLVVLELEGARASSAEAASPSPGPR